MTAPTGSMGKARQYLRAMLAASSAFRTWVDADNEAQALNHLFYDALPLPRENAEIYSESEVEAYWPYALIYVQDFFCPRTSHDAFFDGGEFGIHLCQAVMEGDTDSPDEISTKLYNVAEGIMSDLKGGIQTAGYLDFEGIGIDGPMCRSHPDDAEGIRDEVELDLSVVWGTEGG